MGLNSRYKLEHPCVKLAGPGRGLQHSIGLLCWSCPIPGLICHHSALLCPRMLPYPPPFHPPATPGALLNSAVSRSSGCSIGRAMQASPPALLALQVPQTCFRVLFAGGEPALDCVLHFLITHLWKIASIGRLSWHNGFASLCRRALFSFSNASRWLFIIFRAWHFWAIKKNSLSSLNLHWHKSSCKLYTLTNRLTEQYVHL